MIVNRIWQHHFGQGIVATPNDFGSQGSRPSHPELLDWLANALIKNGWRLKADPSADRHQCRLHARQSVRRIACGRRSRERVPTGGTLHADSRPSRSATRCSRPPGTSIGGCTARARSTSRCRVGASYLFIKRSRLIPMMMLFDWPEHLVSIGQRSTTTTAPQALAMLNSGLARHCAEGLAQRVAAAGDPTSSSGAGLSNRLRPRPDRDRGKARRLVSSPPSDRPTPATAAPIPTARRSSIFARRLSA